MASGQQAGIPIAGSEPVVNEDHILALTDQCCNTADENIHPAQSEASRSAWKVTDIWLVCPSLKCF